MPLLVSEPTSFILDWTFEKQNNMLLVRRPTAALGISMIRLSRGKGHHSSCCFKNQNYLYHYMSKDKIHLIAEIGINHNGDISIAKRLIKEAKVAGFDIVKL